MKPIDIFGWVVVIVMGGLFVYVMAVSVYYDGSQSPECTHNSDCTDYCLSLCDDTRYVLEKTRASCRTTIFQGDRCICGDCFYDRWTEVRP